MRSVFLVPLGFLACAFQSGCSSKPSDRQANVPQAGQEDASLTSDHPYHQRLLDISKEYKNYLLVDKQEPKMRFALTDCRSFTQTIRKVHVRERVDTKPHNQKLYRLYAARFDESLQSYHSTQDAAGAVLPVTGQIIVKESWHADGMPSRDDALTGRSFAIGSDGKHYFPGARGPLFIMFQDIEKPSDTDDGWVYGTVTSDGKTVTGVGLIESCMNCHQKAPYGRLFGLAKPIAANYD